MLEKPSLARHGLFFLLVGIATIPAPALGQPTVLSFRPAAAAYSKALDRIIFVSSNPNTLHIYDPVANTDLKVSLTQPPLSLSLSPDGLHAAVGHDGLISYVNLSPPSVLNQFVVPITATGVILSPSWIYVMPVSNGTSVSVNLSTGAVIPNPSVFFQDFGWLNTSVNAIYGTRDGTSPDDVEEYDISTGPITRQFDSPYHGDYCIYGPVWFSPDGSRVYTGCGTIFHASKDPALDMYYLSSIHGVSFIRSLDESASLHTIALIQGGPPYPDPSQPSRDGIVQLFKSDNLERSAQFALTPFSVNGTEYMAHGKWVFFNRASTELYAIIEADQTSGLLNDFAVQRVSLGAPVPCGAAFQSATDHVSASGTKGTVDIVAAPACIYEAATDASWIQIASGAYGSGNGTLTYLTRPNYGAVPRTGVISLGSDRFTVVQDGATASGPITPLSYTVLDSAYAKAIDQIILISDAPDELHIFDPHANTERTVSLPAAPLSLSVRPDGAYAAVGHDGSVSWVNLLTAKIERTFQVVTDVSHILAAGNGYVYLFPGRDWSDIYSLEIASGTVTATQAIYEGRIPRLYSTGKYMYVGGNWFSKWDISGGVAAIVSQTGGSNTCGNLWLSEDGRRAFTACGAVYTTSDIPAQDWQSNGTLSATSQVTWADESAQQHITAVIPGANGYSSSAAKQADDTQVQLYQDSDLSYSGAIPLPSFTVGGNSYSAHGRFVFWSRNATELYVVMDADNSAQLLSSSGVARLELSSAIHPNITKIVNAASQTEGRISPGELISIYGTGLGPSTGVSFTIDPATRLLNTVLGGTQVFINGVAAPVLYASDRQINAMVPYEIAYSSSVPVQVGFQNVVSPATTMSVSSSMPALFTMNATGSGQAAALNLDGTVTDAAHPAGPGSVVTLYVTGGGLTNPPGTTGGVSGLDLRYLTQTALVTVGDQPAKVLFAGAAPTLVDGVEQMNIQLADNTPSGAQPVIVTVGIDSSPATATIAVR